MEKKDTFKIILNKSEKDIPQLALKKSNISDAVFTKIFNDHQYFVQSDVSEEVFDAFIKYWIENKIPDININNIWQYNELSSEFGLMAEIINEKKKQMSDEERVLDCLNNPNIKDKSILIEEISKDLDNYLMKHGTVLINQPIQTLISIFDKRKKENEFKEHNLAYKLIIDQYKETKDSNILILLQYIDGKHLNHEYLRDSIENSIKRNNYMVKFDFSYIIDIDNRLKNEHKIQRQQKDQIDKLQNYISNLENKLKSLETRFDKQNQQNKQKFDQLNTTIDEHKKAFQQTHNSIKKQIEINEEINSKFRNDCQNEHKKLNDNIKIKENDIKTKINELQNKCKLLNDNFENQKIELKKQENNINQSLLQIKEENKDIINGIKYSTESAFCHKLYHYIKNNLQLNQIYFPGYQSSYVYKPVSNENPGILSYLKGIAKDDFDRQYIVTLSKRDPYYLFDVNKKVNIYSANMGDFEIEITLKDAIDMTGFEITSTKINILKSYQIFINDKLVLNVDEDQKMRDNHNSRYNLKIKECKKFKLVQTGPNWDRDDKGKKNIVGLSKIEFFTNDHPEGLFKYWSQQNIYNGDPHLWPVKFDSKYFSTEYIHDLQSQKAIPSVEGFCKIKFLNGAVSVDGYRLKRNNLNYKMKGWKIVGKTMSNQKITISEFVDSSDSSDPLHISSNDEIKNKEFVKSIEIFRTEANWDSSKFLGFHHFEIFGQYIPNK